MQNHELAEINASLQEIVRRAYDLGRSEALKRVLDVLSTEPPAADQLVLMPPAETMPAPHEDAPSHEQQSAKLHGGLGPSGDRAANGETDIREREMSVAERVAMWNRWYDAVPGEWQFQYVIWSLLVLGTINMALTVAVRFPFALLVLLGIIVITAIRVPYVLGWVTSPTGGDADWNFQIAGAGWLIDLNRRYEALPKSRRMWVYPAVLLIAGAINMMLTIRYGFPFGLLFLVALLALVVIRAPYTGGWLRSAAPATSGESDQALLPAESESYQSPANSSSSDTYAADEAAHAAGSRDTSVDQTGTERFSAGGLSGEGPVEPHDDEVKKGGE